MLVYVVIRKYNDGPDSYQENLRVYDDEEKAKAFIKNCNDEMNAESERDKPLIEPGPNQYVRQLRESGFSDAANRIENEYKKRLDAIKARMFDANNFDISTGVAHRIEYVYEDHEIWK